MAIGNGTTTRTRFDWSVAKDPVAEVSGIAPACIGLGITVSMEHITPDDAAAYLALNKGNRRLRAAQVERLARKLSDGLFDVTHQGLAFDKDGLLIDGQHRLMAILKAETPALLVVFRGMPRSSMLSVDENGPRNVADIYGQVCGESSAVVTVNETATATAMYYSVDYVCSGRPLSKSFWISYINEHLDAIQFASQVFRAKGGVCHSAFRGVVARAWYTQDHERLAQFAHVCATGFADRPEDYAAVALRQWYQANKKNTGGNHGRSSLYRRAVMALQAFIREQPLKFVREANREAFKLPGEK